MYSKDKRPMLINEGGSLMKDWEEWGIKEGGDA